MIPRSRGVAAAAILFPLAARTARADDVPEAKRWVPTASLSLGGFDERLRVQVDGTDHDTFRGQLRTFAALGLSHPVTSLPGEAMWIDGQASVGLGPTFQTGHWQVPLREDVTFAYAATRWLVLRGGLGLGLTLDATSTARSFGELALPIALTFFHTFDLVYRPMLAVPLGSETSAVFGGQRQLSTRLAFVPFETFRSAPNESSGRHFVGSASISAISR